MKVPLNQRAATVGRPKLLGQALRLLGSAERYFRDEMQILGRQKIPSQQVKAWSLPCLFSPLEVQRGDSVAPWVAPEGVGKVRMTRNGTGAMRVPLWGLSSSSQTPGDNVCGLILPGLM